MIILGLIGELALGFIFGTLVLWACSLTVKTENANLRTAAIYNSVMTILRGVLFGIAILFLHTESGIVEGVLIASTFLSIAISFWLLMRMYTITFLATLWLVIAMWVVQTGVVKLIDFVL
jgi:hypothetical protein